MQVRTVHDVVRRAVLRRELGGGVGDADETAVLPAAEVHPGRLDDVLCEALGHAPAL